MITLLLPLREQGMHIGVVVGKPGGVLLILRVDALECFFTSLAFFFGIVL